ncbi:MAG: DUF2294 domain-containing protein [Candidatus Omnitrophota bacterium]|nr:DUF2294 domain-containing protein [Candidatus Omnitrophota bacterium]
MTIKSKQDVEVMICQKLTMILKEQIGEQVETAAAEVAGDTIIVRFKGVLPPAERMMVKKEEGMELIKELKEKLIEKIKPLLEQTIKELTGAEVVDVHSSFNPETGERVEMFTLNKDLKDGF